MRSFRKAWEVFLPWLIYYLTYNAAYLILIFFQSLAQNKLGEAYGRWMAAHSGTVSGVTGGICMLLGVWPLLPALKRELTKRVDEPAVSAKKGIAVFVTVVFSAASSLGLNGLLTLTGLADTSRTYQEVAGRQYGVAFGVGILLYGLVSPLAEEVVFRGVIFNRLRRLYGSIAAVFVSGILFGAFHGNLVQGVYGTCMGIFIAYVYERRGRFFFPFLFHMTANLAVYCTAYMQPVQRILFTPPGCAVLLAVSAGCVFWMEKVEKYGSGRKE